MAKFEKFTKKQYVPEPYIPTGFVIKRSTTLGIQSFLERSGLTPTIWNAMSDEDQSKYYQAFGDYHLRRSNENRGGGAGE